MFGKLTDEFCLQSRVFHRHIRLHPEIVSRSDSRKKPSETPPRPLMVFNPAEQTRNKNKFKRSEGYQNPTIAPETRRTSKPEHKKPDQRGRITKSSMEFINKSISDQQQTPVSSSLMFIKTNTSQKRNWFPREPRVVSAAGGVHKRVKFTASPHHPLRSLLSMASSVFLSTCQHLCSLFNIQFQLNT